MKTIIMGIVLCTAATAQHKQFVGTNSGTNNYLEARVELGGQHNTYVVKIERTDVKMSMVSITPDDPKGSKAVIPVGGTIDKYFVWGTRFVLQFSTPLTQVIVLDERSSDQRAGSVLDPVVNMGCDVIRGYLVCIDAHRSKNERLVTEAHVFDDDLKERICSMEALGSWLGRYRSDHHPNFDACVSAK
jgi:hypothetical protein